MSPLNRGADLRDAEALFIKLGGTVEQAQRGHLQYRYAGLPTVGVQTNRKTVPRKLVSRIEEGKVVTAPRVASRSFAQDSAPQTPSSAGCR